MPTRPFALHHFVCLSRATAPLGVEALQTLLQKARAYNYAHRITGLLLYSDGLDNTPGVFFQILEMSEAAVRRLMLHIRLDGRNTELHVLVDGPTDQRMFPDSAMGFTALVPPDVEALTGYLDPARPASCCLAPTPLAPGCASSSTSCWPNTPSGLTFSTEPRWLSNAALGPQRGLLRAVQKQTGCQMLVRGCLGNPLNVMLIWRPRSEVSLPLRGTAHTKQERCFDRLNMTV